MMTTPELMNEQVLPAGVGSQMGMRRAAAPASRCEGAGQLLQKALVDVWNVDEDLPWETRVDLDSLDVADRESLVAQLPEYRKLDAKDQHQLKLRELGWNLSNLLEGEWRGGVIAAQIMVDCAPESRDTAAFMSTVANDEVKHHHVLRRYLQENTSLIRAPHAGLDRLFNDLQGHEVWELKLLIGQVVFEAPATSTIHSLFMRSGREPLLSAILRRILRDEARHLAFSNAVTGSIARRYSSSVLRSVEDMLFEAVVACVATFPAEPVWHEMGFPREASRRHAVEALAERGILDVYTRLLPKQLASRGFPVVRLSHLLQNGLVPRLLAGAANA